MTRLTMLGCALVAGMTAGCVARDEPDFSADRLKAHVAFLANDLVEGREAGTRGEGLESRQVGGPVNRQRASLHHAVRVHQR